MKILILCDRESRSFEGMNLQSHVQRAVEKSNYETQIIELNGDEIKSCSGCFKCWVKTPGLCVKTDDLANKIASKEIQSDVVVFLSKITYGAYSYDIKSFLDRSIPNISPFFEIVNDEMHHKMRYNRFPIMITIGYGNCSTNEHETFTELVKRNALNMRPPKHFEFTIYNINQIDETIQSLKKCFIFRGGKCLT